MNGTVYDDYIPGLVDSLLQNLGQTDNNVLLIKHYNTFDLEEAYVKALSETRTQAQFLYHSFDISGMLTAYEPFMGWIRKLYEEAEEPSLEEFLDKNHVYPLHRAVLQSYLETGICSRQETVLMDEIEYETRRMQEEILHMLGYFAQKKPLFLVLNKIHAAGKSTVDLIMRLISEQPNSNLVILATYNESAPELVYSRDRWQSFLQYMEERDYTVDWTLDAMVLSREINPGFEFNGRKLEKYYSELSNMYYMLALEQAEYYLNFFYHKFEIEKVYVSLKYKFLYLELYAKVAMCLHKGLDALQYCDGMRLILEVVHNQEWEYRYYMLVAEAYMLTYQNEQALQQIERCQPVCEELKNPLYSFRLELLKYMIRFEGWTNVWCLADGDEESRRLLKKTEEYGFYNHMAHIFVYGFDNAVERYETVDALETMLPNFNKGIKIAMAIGNDQFLIAAYKKNIMLASMNGYHEVVQYFYDKYYEIVKRNKDAVEEGCVFNGMGYTCCTIEEHQQANEYFRKALSIFGKLNDIEYINETLYNMAINSVLAGEYEAADVQFGACLRIVRIMRSNTVRVCNISKIYGLRAYCCYRMGIFYSCKMYAQRVEQFLGNIIELEENDKGVVHLWDDDLFLYFFLKGLLQDHEGQTKEAIKTMDRARKYMDRSKGSEFLNRPIFALGYAEICRKLKLEDRAKKVLKQALQFCEEKKCERKAQILRAALANEAYEPERYDLELDSGIIDRIIERSLSQGMHKRFLEQKKQVDFLGIWQKFVNNTETTVQQVVNEALASLKKYFELDAMTFIRVENGKSVIRYDDSPYGINANKAAYIVDYFNKNRRGFAVTRLDKGYVDQKELIQYVFGTTGINTWICAPIFLNEQLNSVFVATVDLGMDWNYREKKYEFDEDELSILTFLYRELLDAMERMEARNQINSINNELQFVNDRLKELAVRDTLTGLYNRQGFNEEFEVQMKRAKKANRNLEISFLYADLDNFKYYNDTFGHDVGDLILKQYAKLIKGICEARGFAVRYGGDEFILVLYTDDHREIEEAAKSIYLALDHERGFVRQISGELGRAVDIPREKYLSCSIGISTTVLSEKDMTKEKIEETLKKADQMMYYVKKTTKHRYIFYEE